jgi:hypothetical protein
MKRSCWALFVVLLLTGSLAMAAEEEKKEKAKQESWADMTKCEMTFDIKGWSAIYKKQQGQGRITCDNGQSADVEIKVKGGGLTVGKTEMVDAKGKFTEVRDIEELFGAYATGSAHAGAAKSAAAMIVTKGNITFTFTGTGTGFNLGVDAGRFVIKPKGADKDGDKPPEQAKK